MKALSVATRLAAWSKDERGTIVIMFALLLVPLLLFTGGAIDFSRYNAVRADLIESLDAAGLAMAQLDELNPPEIADLEGEEREEFLKDYGRDFFHENFRSDGLIEGLAVDFVLTPTTITPTASGVLRTVILGAAGSMMGGSALSSLDITSDTEITRRGSGNIELALLLDTTASMAGSKITDLIAAAKDLVNIVVDDEQTPFYSKVALVPYGASVNLGSYASTVRGSITGGRAITGASWAAGSPIGISGITRANPAVVTANGHGLNNGDVVWISGVSGMTQVNNRAYTVANKTTNTFQLQGTNSSSWSSYSSSSSDYVTRCQVAQCRLVITSNNHGFTDGAHVFISGISGLSLNSVGTSAGAQAINNTAYSASTWQVGTVTTNTFTLSSHASWNNPALGPYYNSYTSGGTAFCTTPGCQYFRFTNGDGNIKVNPITTCVSERTGGNAYTDASYTTTLFGRTYPPSHHCVANNVITPLSSDKALLRSKIDLLTAGGPSGGHVGVGWGWYLVSPNFAPLFPTNSQPAAYTAPNVQKVVVLMTDGEYNSSYCNGVVSNVTSTSGSGSTSDKINCAAPNGHSYDQSQALCAAMKTAGVIVYTVGFQVVADPRATALINGCATSPRHVYMAATGAQLREAFQTIAGEVSELRVSR
ncbi:MAG: pilus assembly protein TadG [Parvularculaceae bacterium]|nr:pilus assembly protein TadG [Parvularculaceae bacterium]